MTSPPEGPQQVEAIGDLPRLWRTLARTLGVKPGAVTADNFDLWVPLEPLGGGSRRAIRKQVNHSPAFQVDDHRPVSHPFPPSPIVDASHADKGRIGVGSGAPLDIS
ncbi:hypothetical protein SAMN05444161_9071 [Rhizobiales bacterium GAS191]|nr:hypothetical protein SAMN05444161_9071 [Rhizobiales bacterium GAS191]